VERFTNHLGMEFVRIPAGCFTMGATPEDADAEWNEHPAISVQVSEDFFLATKPVTVGDFSRYLSLPGGELAARDAAQTANYLSAVDADLFVENVNSCCPADERHIAYRLPSEAEWEYSCRAGTTTRFYFGDDLQYAALGEYAWFADNAWHAGLRSPPRPGCKRANPWGLYDMHGNVWEWTNDGWVVYDELARYGNAARDPATRVLRGGAWCHDGRYLRSSDRDHYAPDYRHYYTGMRLAFHLR